MKEIENIRVVIFILLVTSLLEAIFFIFLPNKIKYLIFSETILFSIITIISIIGILILLFSKKPLVILIFLVLLPFVVINHITILILLTIFYLLIIIILIVIAVLEKKNKRINRVVELRDSGRTTKPPR